MTAIAWSSMERVYCITALLLTACSYAQSLKQVDVIDLPGPPGKRFDYLTIDYDDADPDHYRKLEDFVVQKRVHSLAVDAETHRVYAPEEWQSGRPVARMVVYEAINYH